MATAMFAKTMDNYPRSMSPPPKAEVTYWTPAVKTEGQEIQILSQCDAMGYWLQLETVPRIHAPTTPWQ
jgi:hypothetical protein